MTMRLERSWVAGVVVASVLGACSDSEMRDGGPAGPDSSIAIDGGRAERDASVAPADASTSVDAGTVTRWASCEAYEASMAARPGDPCTPATFGNCGSGDRCCTRTVSCSRDGAVLDETVCLDGCPMVTTCPGYAPPASGVTTCRTETDCAGRGLCFPPGEPSGCGPPPIQECVTDADCVGDTVERICVEAGVCGGTACVPVCTARGATCADGTTCDAATGRCAPISCEDGWECPASAACSRGLGTPDAHGCARRDCLDDLDCDCGACVLGFCHDGPGYCAFPAP